jgi:hypothetical protein
MSRAEATDVPAGNFVRSDDHLSNVDWFPPRLVVDSRLVSIRAFVSIESASPKCRRRETIVFAESISAYVQYPTLTFLTPTGRFFGFIS